LLANEQGGSAGTLWLNMKNGSESDKNSRVPLDDAPFAILILAVISFTLIIFVLTITLLLS